MRMLQLLSVKEPRRVWRRRDGAVAGPLKADDIRQLRNHGSKGSYKHEKVGFNSRLDEIQAGILLVKFKRIDEYNEKRRQRAALYNEFLSDSITLPVERPGAKHVYHQYTLRSRKETRYRRHSVTGTLLLLFIIPFPSTFRKRSVFWDTKREISLLQRTQRKKCSRCLSILSCLKRL